jgi:hypothetical protein
MNMAHWHLLLNHFPLFGTFIGIPLLIFGLVRKNGSITNAALFVLAVAAVVTIPVYLTGEPAEEIVEHLPGVLHDNIESHEDFAKFALISAIGTGIAAIAGLVAAVRFKSAATMIATITLILAFITGGLMAWTANLGGPIRHTEISGASATQTGSDRENRREDDDR